MVKRSRRSSYRRTKRRSVRSTRSRRHHRARHTRRRGKRMGGMPPRPDYLNPSPRFTPEEIKKNEEERLYNLGRYGET